MASTVKKINLSNIKPARGSKHRRKILGRGEGSGHGQTATRGMKGQGSRSGDTRMMGFEGGQMPLMRRLPKRGFNNTEFKKSFAVVNLDDLDRVYQSGDEVNADSLMKKRLLQDSSLPVKVLGRGQLTKKLTVRVHAASAQARQAIEKSGGHWEQITA